MKQPSDLSDRWKNKVTLAYCDKVWIHVWLLVCLLNIYSLDAFQMKMD